MRKTIVTLMSILVIGFLLEGCATSEKIQTVQVGDNQLSCNQLKKELEKLDQAERDVKSKKGMTGTNVASTLFWLPGLAYTYYDAGQAMEAINGRCANLTKFYNNKNCR
uniref:Lipoprotein n=1 Tax=Candidatus Kentrum sp. LPFa TaxID=2126335 RepID=A0A450XA61_9GAMM|nr:MAG: hypothetical protein BECKLPF1236A_GA0070988_100298 [Candidatus Kentron sp. LPFa]VFK26165.1 MAG: hypothetical protein BECKLPF1236C_GA0070990_100318 [Candidatus Kentron sp. LPFa]